MEAVTETASPPLRRPWPPSAPHDGAEPSVGEILLILIAATSATHALSGLLPRVVTPMEAAGWHAAVGGLRLVMWLGIVAAFGWLRPVGLGRGGASPWGIIPLVAVSSALVLGGWPWNVPHGISFAVILAGSDALGALREEIVFRGFLFHGLSRRVGGACAVVVGSGLFALSHLPRYVREERVAADVVALLIVVFCLGILLCRIRAATGSIWLPTAIHALWNVTVGVRETALPAAGWEPITLVSAAPFALGAVLFASLVLPRVWPRAFGALGAFRILGSDHPAPRAAS